MGEFKAIFGSELVIVALVLFVFGYFYNRLVSWMQEKTSSYTAEFVVIGVLVTLLGAGFIIGWPQALAVGILFTASGAFMIAGAWKRHADDSERAKQETREYLKHGD